MNKLFKNLFGNKSQKENAKTTEKVGSSQKTKAFNQIHTDNEFDETLRQTELTKAYIISERKLRKKPYAERKFKTKENIIKVRNFYPYLSVFLSLSVGIMTGDLFASGLNEFGYFLTLGILTIAVFLVAWLLEDLKRDACREYFETIKPTGKQRF